MISFCMIKSVFFEIFNREHDATGLVLAGNPLIDKYWYFRLRLVSAFLALVGLQIFFA